MSESLAEAPSATTGTGEATVDPDQLAGLCVLHLFARVTDEVRRADVCAALSQSAERGCQLVTVAVLGHKADLGLLALHESPHELRRLQSRLRDAHCKIEWSYLSLTELSEYSGGVPDTMKLARLRPHVPPDGYEAFCFYPMSRRRLGDDNWYRVAYDERFRMMMEHGQSGREFRGRVVQLVTGSTGLDAHEWGVTLFARTLDDLKACVYAMRFDEASARFAEFGDFVTGLVGSADEVLDLIGVTR